MFPKKNRLNNKEFEELWKNGQGIPTAIFSIKVKKDSELKVAVTVSKKLVNRAVKRNFIKRRVLHIIKDTLKSQNINKKMSLIINVRKNIEDISIKDIKQEIEMLFVKNQILD